MARKERRDAWTWTGEMRAAVLPSLRRRSPRPPGRSPTVPRAGVENPLPNPDGRRWPSHGPGGEVEPSPCELNARIRREINRIEHVLLRGDAPEIEEVCGTIQGGLVRPAAIRRRARRQTDRGLLHRVNVGGRSNSVGRCSEGESGRSGAVRAPLPNGTPPSSWVYATDLGPDLEPSYWLWKRSCVPIPSWSYGICSRNSPNNIPVSVLSRRNSSRLSALARKRSVQPPDPH